MKIIYSRLAIVDSLLILDTSIQRSIVPHFLSTSPIYPLWYTLSFPYFWHPFKGITRTITTYMMVMISCDRYRAVCYPFHRNYVSYLVLVWYIFPYNWKKNYYDYLLVNLVFYLVHNNLHRFRNCFVHCIENSDVFSIPPSHNRRCTRVLDNIYNGLSRICFF